MAELSDQARGQDDELDEDDEIDETVRTSELPLSEPT